MYYHKQNIKLEKHKLEKIKQNICIWFIISRDFIKIMSLLSGLYKRQRVKSRFYINYIIVLPRDKQAFIFRPYIL